MEDMREYTGDIQYAVEREGNRVVLKFANDEVVIVSMRMPPAGARQLAADLMVHAE